MARQARVEYPGALYHVTSRGNDRRPIFKDDNDRLHFLELLKLGVEEYEVDLHAWVLMVNHYHLVIRTRQANLSRFMHFLNTSYTVWMNNRHRRTGHLFEGRYKGIVLQEEGYLLSVTVYVCLNPVRVKGWRERPVKEKFRALREYNWSSYHEYGIGSRGRKWPAVRCAQIWGELGGRTQRQGRRQFRRYAAGWLEEDRQRVLKDPADKGKEGNPLSEVGLQLYLGDDGFRDFIQDMLGKDGELKESLIGAGEWERHPEVGKVLELGCNELGMEFERLSRRTRNDRNKAMLMHVCQRLTRCGLRQLADVLGITHSGISRRLRVFRDELYSNEALRRNVEGIEKRLSHYLKT